MRTIITTQELITEIIGTEIVNVAEMGKIRKQKKFDRLHLKN